MKKYRTQAREILAKAVTGDPQINKESKQLLMHLDRLNILPPNSTLDDVLALDTESILSRRLQTLTYLKGLANTPDHARQLISHGHIAIGERRVTVPSYMVTRDEEGEIGYTSESPLNDTMHPARPRADFKSMGFTKPPLSKEIQKPITERPDQKPKPIDEPSKETKDKKTETKQVEMEKTKEKTLDNKKSENKDKEKPKVTESEKPNKTLEKKDEEKINNKEYKNKTEK